jgi:hypothetical protein
VPAVLVLVVRNLLLLWLAGWAWWRAWAALAPGDRPSATPERHPEQVAHSAG